jgi:hypothetical protein
VIERFLDDVLEIEANLAKSLRWSLREIDLTDTGSLMQFVRHLSGGGPERQAYIDDVMGML